MNDSSGTTILPWMLPFCGPIERLTDIDAGIGIVPGGYGMAYRMFDPLSNLATTAYVISLNSSSERNLSTKKRAEEFD